MISREPNNRTAAGLIVASAIAIAIAFLASASSARAQSGADPQAATSATSLDFDFFKSHVEPIFLEKREGHARCYTCHAQKAGRPARYVGEKPNPESAFGEKGGSYQATPIFLDRIAKGSSFWTDEQSRDNFKRVSGLVVPGDPTSSPLLMHPLAPEAGGDAPFWHGGGRQFANEDDPDWRTIAEWVRGAKASHGK